MDNYYQDIPENYNTPPFYPPQQGIDRSGSVFRELSPQEHLRDIIEHLRGKMWDNNQKKYIKIEGVKPFMNDEGIDTFFQYSTAVLSPIVTFSNYGNNYKTISNLMIFQLRRAIIHFHTHWKDYGISSETKINIITNKLLILGLSAFYKAIGAGDRGAATRNISESISRMIKPDEPQAPEKRGSMFQRIMGR